MSVRHLCTLSFMNVCVASGKLDHVWNNIFLPFPLNPETLDLSQPLNAWKNRSALLFLYQVSQIMCAQSSTFSYSIVRIPPIVFAIHPVTGQQKTATAITTMSMSLF